MAKLPHMPRADNIYTRSINRFGGYTHISGASNGEIYDMENMSPDEFPLMTPRKPRELLRSLEKPNGLYGRDELCWVDGTGFYYAGEHKGEVEDSPKRFVSLRERIIILPDKAYYDIYHDEFGQLELTYVSGAGQISFGDGILYEEAAESNTITTTGAAFEFRAGDAVTISGCTFSEKNNKTPVIREISADGKSLYFYEHIFDNGTEPGAITLSRSVPDMDYICENENRLWGCKGDTIYASKLGDPFNWNVFEGLETDAWSVDVGSAGDFTGCVSYLGYPIFFKQKSICKIYGSKPTNYQMLASATLGADGGNAFAIAGETLLYPCRGGVAAYNGGVPAIITQKLGVRLEDAVAGTDGLRYYISAREGTARHLFVYDTLSGQWYREDGLEVCAFAHTDRLYMLCTDGRLLSVSGGDETVRSMAEFADFYEHGLGKTCAVRLHVRAETAPGAVLTFEVRYDSGRWRRVKTFRSGKKAVVKITLPPVRCTHYALRITGEGQYKIYGLEREITAGSLV